LSIAIFCELRSCLFLTNREGAKDAKEERRGEEKSIEIIHNLCENCFVNLPCLANALFGLFGLFGQCLKNESSETTAELVDRPSVNYWGFSRLNFLNLNPAG
jgi:hypothetical protein